MKNRLLLALSLLTVTSLASCSTGSIYGTYKFQLGTTKGTHIGVYMELQSKDYYASDASSSQVKKGQCWNLDLDFTSMLSSSQTSSEEAASSDSSAVSSSVSSSSEDSGIKVSGYYTVTSKDGVNYLNLGTTTFLNLTVLTSGSLDGYTLDIPPALVEKIAYATLDTDLVNVILPVSDSDLFLQLYWYGYRVNPTDIFDFSELPEEDHHAIGTHPSEEDVQAIREEEAQSESPVDLYKNFRDYHTLTMGLMK